MASNTIRSTATNLSDTEGLADPTRESQREFSDTTNKTITKKFDGTSKANDPERDVHGPRGCKQNRDEDTIDDGINLLLGTDLTAKDEVRGKPKWETLAHRWNCDAEIAKSVVQIFLNKAGPEQWDKETYDANWKSYIELDKYMAENSTKKKPSTDTDLRNHNEFMARAAKLQSGINTVRSKIDRIKKQAAHTALETAIPPDDRLGHRSPYDQYLDATLQNEVVQQKIEDTKLVKEHKNVDGKLKALESLSVDSSIPCAIEEGNVIPLSEDSADAGANGVIFSDHIVVVETNDVHSSEETTAGEVESVSLPEETAGAGIKHGPSSEDVSVQSASMIIVPSMIAAPNNPKIMYEKKADENDGASDIKYWVEKDEPFSTSFDASQDDISNLTTAFEEHTLTESVVVRPCTPDMEDDLEEDGFVEVKLTPPPVRPTFNEESDWVVVREPLDSEIEVMQLPLENNSEHNGTFRRWYKFFRRE